MKEWADQIISDGNEAAHGEDETFTREDAEQIKEFTELFLIYAFTLPERVRQAKPAEQEGEPEKR